MTVYLDTMGHLRADTPDELHAFAQQIGLRREWYQDRPRLWHYDITTASKQRRAIRAGAVLVDPRFIVTVGALEDGEA